MMGVPVIAADTGGVYSLIEDEVDGLLAYTGEEADFVEAIKLLWVDRGFAREIADAGRRRALKRHDRKAVVDGLLDIYKDVIRHYKMRLDLGTE
ncbi:MAG: glycosyltransferase [Bacteroidales bacterium]|nr:glycosyltransferase [Bacteroidales bacterium]